MEKNKRKKSQKAWLNSWGALMILFNENGCGCYLNGIYNTKRALRERMGNEWAGLALKVRITIEEL